MSVFLLILFDMSLRLPLLLLSLSPFLSPSFSSSLSLSLSHFNSFSPTSISRNGLDKNVRRKILNKQHHAYILEANYYLSVSMCMHFKLALSTG